MPETALPIDGVPLKWSDIHGEKSRTYHYPDGSKFTVKEVTRICVRPSGNHRLETGDGKKFIVKGGWIAIEAESDRWSA